MNGRDKRGEERSFLSPGLSVWGLAEAFTCQGLEKEKWVCGGGNSWVLFRSGKLEVLLSFAQKQVDLGTQTRCLKKEVLRPLEVELQVKMRWPGQHAVQKETTWMLLSQGDLC